MELVSKGVLTHIVVTNQGLCLEVSCVNEICLYFQTTQGLTTTAFGMAFKVKLIESE